MSADFAGALGSGAEEYAERARLAAKAATTGILTIRDLCGDADLERYDAHDHCTRHGVTVVTDGICPVTLGILAAERNRAADAVLAEAARLAAGHHEAGDEHGRIVSLAEQLAAAVRRLS